MAYTPPVINDNDVATPVSAAATIALHENTYDQAVADAASGTNVIDVTSPVVGIVEGGGSGAANVTAWNNLMTGLTGNSEIFFPAGTYDFNGVLSPILDSNVMVRGAGMGATMLRQEATSTTGRFFTIGNALGTQVGRVTIRDLGVLCLNTAAGSLPDNSPAFYVQQAGNWTIENIYCFGISQFLRLGVDNTDVTSSHGGFVNNVVGTLQDAGGLMILIRRGGSTIFQNMELHVQGGTSSGNAVTIQSYDNSPAGIEPLRFTNCAFWSPRLADVGQPRCVFIDMNNGWASNVWFDSCDFDNGEVAAVDISASGAPPTGIGRAGFIKFTNCYMGKGSAGNAVRIFINEPTAKVISAQFVNCKLGSRQSPPVRVSGSGVIEDLKFIGCQVIDGDDSVTKSAAFSMGKDNFMLIGNQIRGFDDEASTGFDYAVETTNDVGFFTVADNQAKHMNTGFFDHFDYASHAHTANARVVHDNWPKDDVSLTAAATLKIPPHASFVTVTGATAITAIEGPANRLVTLRFVNAPQVQNTANILLAGAANKTFNGNDTLTLASSTGAVWWEVCRSEN